MKAIMYHYVRLDDPSLPYFRHLHFHDFQRQLDYFTQNFRPVARDELARSFQTGAPIKDGIVLTFDDGFKDHYQFVFPELTKRGLFGIFYIPTFPYVTGRLLDVHKIHMLIGAFGGKAILESLLKMVSDDMLSHAHVREFHEQTYKTQSNDDFTNRVKRTLNYFIDYKFREQVIDSLMAEFFPHEPNLARDFYVTEHEIGKMKSAGMLIGSHGVNHRCMSKLPVADQKREIEESFTFLEKTIGPADLKTFCYPYGGFHSFTHDTERLLEETGCLFSFNVERRDIERSDLLDRRQALPRYDCNLFPHGAHRSSTNN